MKVLIITYYWPPAGGSGVQRWLKFVKYLQEFDIESIIYTADDPEYALLDNSLQNEVPENIKILKQPIWEPNKFLSKLKSKQQQTSAGFLNPNPSFFERILHYVRANFFIPDARKYWVKPSIKYLSEYLNNNQIDLIISTGPPHSMHLIAMELKKTFPLKWIADFRDPWTDLDYFHQLPLSKNSKRKHQNLEKKVLEMADAVIVVGETMKKNYQKSNNNIHVITNGFDSGFDNDIVALDSKFTITHIGLMNADRNPILLWEVLSEMINEDLQFAKDLQVKLIGRSADGIYKSIKKNKLENKVQFISYLPHDKVIKHQISSQILFIAVNNVPAAKGIITGKIFEYLQANRPILAIAPEDGDLAKIINNTRSGTVVGFEKKKELKKVILDLYRLYKSDNLKIESKNIDQYHRRNLTKRLADLIKNILQ